MTMGPKKTKDVARSILEIIQDLPDVLGEYQARRELLPVTQSDERLFGVNARRDMAWIADDQPPLESLPQHRKPVHRPASARPDQAQSVRRDHLPRAGLKEVRPLQRLHRKQRGGGEHIHGRTQLDLPLEMARGSEVQ